MGQWESESCRNSRKWLRAYSVSWKERQMPIWAVKKKKAGTADVSNPQSMACLVSAFVMTNSVLTGYGGSETGWEDLDRAILGLRVEGRRAGRDTLKLAWEQVMRTDIVMCDIHGKLVRNWKAERRRPDPTVELDRHLNEVRMALKPPLPPPTISSKGPLHTLTHCQVFFWVLQFCHPWFQEQSFHQMCTPQFDSYLVHFGLNYSRIKRSDNERQCYDWLSFGWYCLKIQCS